MELLLEQYKDIKIEEVCRICLKKENVMDLLSEGGLTKMLLECTSVKVSKNLKVTFQKTHEN